VLRGLQNILIYIDNMLIHTDTHERHLDALEQVLMRLHRHHLKINLDKCPFGDQQVSYLGFTLTPQGIKPGKAKLKAIKLAKAPTDVKSICSFVWLCNFFQEPYPELHNHGSPIVQADTAGLRIPIRTFTYSCKTSLPRTPDAIVPRTYIGLPKIQPRIPPDHKCLHTYHRTTRRTLRYFGTKEWEKPDQSDFTRFQTIKRKRKELYTIFAGNSGCCLGDGQLQQILQKDHNSLSTWIWLWLRI